MRPLLCINPLAGKDHSRKNLSHVSVHHAHELTIHFVDGELSHEPLLWLQLALNVQKLLVHYLHLLQPIHQDVLLHVGFTHLSYLLCEIHHMVSLVIIDTIYSVAFVRNHIFNTQQ